MKLQNIIYIPKPCDERYTHRGIHTHTMYTCELHTGHILTILCILCCTCTHVQYTMSCILYIPSCSVFMFRFLGWYWNDNN